MLILYEIYSCKSVQIRLPPLLIFTAAVDIQSSRYSSAGVHVQVQTSRLVCVWCAELAASARGARSSLVSRHRSLGACVCVDSLLATIKLLLVIDPVTHSPYGFSSHTFISFLSFLILSLRVCISFVNTKLNPRGVLALAGPRDFCGCGCCLRKEIRGQECEVLAT